MRRLIVIVLLISLLPAQALASTTFFFSPLAPCGSPVFDAQDRAALDTVRTSVSSESSFAALILTHAEISDGAIAITTPALQRTQHKDITDVDGPVLLPKLFYPFYRPPRA